MFVLAKMPKDFGRRDRQLPATIARTCDGYREIALAFSNDLYAGGLVTATLLTLDVPGL